jgi:hypothetical protein
VEDAELEQVVENLRHLKILSVVDENGSVDEQRNFQRDGDIVKSTRHYK